MSNPFAWHLLLFYAAYGLGAVLVFGASIGLHHADPTAELDGDADLHPGYLHGDMGEESFLHTAFSFFSLGRVPITIAIMIVCFFFGTIGILLAVLLEPVFGGLNPFLSVLGASVATAFSAPPFTRLIARIMPTTETYGQSKRDFVGASGILTLSSDETSGMAQISSRGDVHNVFVRSKVFLPKGREVVLLDYIEGTDTYLVVDANDIDLGTKGKG